MEVDRSELTREEEDGLTRSTKKIKESHPSETGVVAHLDDFMASEQINDESSVRELVSYKDMLVGDYPGAFEQVFFKDSRAMEADESDDDEEIDGNVPDYPTVRLTKEEKSRIRFPWQSSLIIKVFGRKVGYEYLVFKLSTLWHPQGCMDCVDLGFDFFLIRFEMEADYEEVIKGGPWFIGQYFPSFRGDFLVCCGVGAAI